MTRPPGAGKGCAARASLSGLPGHRHQVEPLVGAQEATAHRVTPTVEGYPFERDFLEPAQDRCPVPQPVLVPFQARHAGLRQRAEDGQSRLARAPLEHPCPAPGARPRPQPLLQFVHPAMVAVRPGNRCVAPEQMREHPPLATPSPTGRLPSVLPSSLQPPRSPSGECPASPVGPEPVEAVVSSCRTPASCRVRPLPLVPPC
jgi:hypothetical protein